MELLLQLRELPDIILKYFVNLIVSRLLSCSTSRKVFRKIICLRKYLNINKHWLRACNRVCLWNLYNECLTKSQRQTYGCIKKNGSKFIGSKMCASHSRIFFVLRYCECFLSFFIFTLIYIYIQGVSQ